MRVSTGRFLRSDKGYQDGYLQRWLRTLPERLDKFGLKIAPEKTQILRFSRFHPGMKRRFAFLGFEFYWYPDR